MGIPQLADLVLETANAPGTGIITLGGAPDGRQTFADAFPNGGEVFYYASDGAQTEWGVGTLTVGSPNTLVRTKVLGNLFGTENALNFTSGITVWCEVPAQCAPSLDDTGLLPVSGSPDYGRDVALSAKAAEKRYVALGSKDPQKISGPVEVYDVAQFNKTVTITGDDPAIHFTRSGVPQWDIWVGDDGILYIRSFDSDGKFTTDYARFKPGVGIEFVPALALLGGAIVPDITDFTSKGALSAKTAEGRYAQLSMLPLRNILTFTSSTTWVVPAGVTKVRCQLLGGGGGGGGDPSGGTCAGGGAAGGYCCGLFDVVPGDSIVITIGAAGAAGTGNNDGGTGGTTSFGTFCSATGGTGGEHTAERTILGAGGVGGVGVGATINTQGAPGNFGVSSAGGGIGASTIWGAGGYEGRGGGLGNPASGFGSGGEGGSVGYAGGEGAPGIVVVEY